MAKKHLKTVGLTLIAHGSNNIYEAVSPLLYEGRHQSGWLRDIYRGISSMMGYSDNQGDLGYAISDFSLTAFAAFSKPVLMESSHRLVSQSMLDPSRTNKLFHYMNRDYKSKFYASSTPVKLFLVGKSGYNLYATFNDDNYLLKNKK